MEILNFLLFHHLSNAETERRTRAEERLLTEKFAEKRRRTITRRRVDTGRGTTQMPPSGVGRIDHGWRHAGSQFRLVTIGRRRARQIVKAETAPVRPAAVGRGRRLLSLFLAVAGFAASGQRPCPGRVDFFAFRRKGPVAKFGQKIELRQRFPLLFAEATIDVPSQDAGSKFWRQIADESELPVT
ncbi:conserved hypothetical protein [Trichinella spiralis]|uniref:hypothetical protein n=1 Tax=Trichinella spiralis TaxID=6334 RepID=UPI0001EFF020|nr:conserved hypothetical protein [Trichinella spiralis]